jgi:hypothetical protein
MECGSGRQRREHVVRKSGLLACRVRACALAAHGHRYIGAFKVESVRARERRVCLLLQADPRLL